MRRTAGQYSKQSLEVRVNHLVICCPFHFSQSKLRQHLEKDGIAFGAVAVVELMQPLEFGNEIMSTRLG